MEPTVTVIVPIYNVEKYIKKCINSLLAQTYKNFEIWAIDDGSPDNSKSIVKDFTLKDKRVKLIEKKNGGYGSVLQYAIQNINTKYFMICDPDDWLSDNAIETLYSAAEKDNLDMVIGDRIDFFGTADNSVYKHVVPATLNISPNQVYYSRNSIQKFAFCQPSPHAKLYKTSIAKNICFPSKVSYTDFILYIMSLANAKRVEYLNKPLAFYYFDRSGNTATDYRPSIVNDYLIVWNSIIDQLHELNDSNLDIIYYRMYGQYKYTLYKYALSSKKPFKDKYTTFLYDSLKRMQMLRFDFPKSLHLSLKEKIIFLGFMDKKTGKLFTHMLVKVKRK